MDIVDEVKEAYMTCNESEKVVFEYSIRAVLRAMEKTRKQIQHVDDVA